MVTKGISGSFYSGLRLSFPISRCHNFISCILIHNHTRD